MAVTDDGALGATTPDGDADELVLLSKDGGSPFTRHLDLVDEGGDGFAVVLSGRADEAAPFDLRVTYNGRRLFGETVDEEFFGGGVGRDRFAETSARLIASVLDDDESGEAKREAVDAVDDVLDEVRALLVGGSLHVVDDYVRDVIAETEDVTFSPGGRGEWTVSFGIAGMSHREYTRRREQVTVSAGAWATASDPPQGFSLPVGASGVLSGDAAPERWRDLRNVWIQLASIGEAPAETERLTAEDLRGRPSLPGVSNREGSISAETLEATVRDDENETLRDVRKALSLSKGKSTVLENAVRALGLADELDDVDPDW